MLIKGFIVFMSKGTVKACTPEELPDVQALAAPQQPSDVQALAAPL
jgi:hypothetical protein